MIQPNSSRTPAQRAWLRFRANRQAMVGLVIIAVATLIALLGANIRPDTAQDANTQQVSISRKAPNFQVTMLRIASGGSEENSGFFNALFFGSKPKAYFEIPIHSFSISSDTISGYYYSGEDNIPGRPFAMHLASVIFPIEPGTLECSIGECAATLMNGSIKRFSMEGVDEVVGKEHIVKKKFLLGTDKFGRDMFSRLLAGTIISLSVGLISVLISLVLGIGLGAIAGYFGGGIDDAITWLINVIWSIPTLLLVIAITFALGKGFVQVFIAVGLTMWVEVARVVRGQVLSLRHMEYIEAARALGYTPMRIILVHVIPNIMGPVIVISAANFASAILLEAGLSFLGIGAQIPMASWGQMIKDHYAYITTNMAYLAILPGLCIMVLVLAFMLVGSGLRDAMDTRSKA